MSFLSELNVSEYDAEDKKNRSIDQKRKIGEWVALPFSVSFEVEFMGSLLCVRLFEPGACEVLELEFEGVEGSEAMDEDKSCDSKIEGSRDKQGIAQPELSIEVHRKDKTGR